MKKKMAMLLALVLALTVGCVAQTEDVYSYDFDDEGYTGTWTTVEELGIEFCLPDGWLEIEAGEEGVYAAEREDGSASVTIRLEATKVDDLEAWAESNLEAWELDEADFNKAVVTEQNVILTARMLLSGGRVLCFVFERTSREAMPRQHAMQIVGSVYESFGE